MLVTFRTQAWGNVSMFGEIAVALLKMMGHSGTVPSALLAADIPAALARLRQQLAAAAPAQAGKVTDDEEDAEAPIGLNVRAHPLIELLTAAAAQERDVTWQAGEPPL